MGSLRQMRRKAKLESDESLLFSFQQLGISCKNMSSNEQQEKFWLEKGCQHLHLRVDKERKEYLVLQPPDQVFKPTLGYEARGYWRSSKDLSQMINMILNLQGL